MRVTARLWLDEALTLGIEGGKDRGYPPISSEARQVLKICATNLFVTESSLCWAYYQAMRGGSEGFKRIRERLLSPAVKIVRA